MSSASVQRCNLASSKPRRTTKSLKLSHNTDEPLLRSRLNSHRFVLSVYIILSLVFFSASLSRGYYPSRLEIRSFTTPSQIRSPSSLNALPSDARLAKLVALQPPPIRFDPLTFLPVINPHSHEITACLWAPESRLDWVSAWTTEWPGPISLLVVTRKPPTSTHSPLYPELVHFLRHPMVNTSRIAIHMLYLDLATPEAPNVFINLARLFAPTSVVLLVPGTPPKPPPSTAISSFFKAQMRDPVIVRAREARPRTRVVADKRRHPVSPALAPVLIPRNHPLWCTERFALVPAHVAVRAADWDVCLWQVQLETFGVPTSVALLSRGGNGMSSLSLLSPCFHR
ncbi:hypothetical protein BGW80DRAFT_869492 [Lactifluus volemus]|nr:hypothetical protein BGW80DRAFT_869492 [Lactifluus volemus]